MGSEGLFTDFQSSCVLPAWCKQRPYDPYVSKVEEHPTEFCCRYLPHRYNEMWKAFHVELARCACNDDRQNLDRTFSRPTGRVKNDGKHHCSQPVRSFSRSIGRVPMLFRPGLDHCRHVEPSGRTPIERLILTCRLQTAVQGSGEKIRGFIYRFLPRERIPTPLWDVHGCQSSLIVGKTYTTGHYGSVVLGRNTNQTRIVHRDSQSRCTHRYYGLPKILPGAIHRVDRLWYQIMSIRHKR